MSLIRIERAEASAAAWNAFAVRCDASHRGLSGWMNVCQTRWHLPFGLHRFNILQQRRGGWCKIAQCAVGIGPKRRVFADGLQLLPQHQDAWPTCMQALLSELGPGQYIYGSEWSLEPPREREIAALPAVSITSVSSYLVEAVDFARWGSWSEYERSISANVRRNVKRAQTKYESLAVELKRGPTALGLARHLLNCKVAMHRRKRKAIDRRKMISTQVFRLLMLPEHAFCAVLRQGGRTLAAFGGVEVGRQTYYFDGGSMAADGTGWLLNMTLMRNFQARHPDGRFVMGYTLVNAGEPTEWESDFRYRRDCRVSIFPTSTVAFART